MALTAKGEILIASEIKILSGEKVYRLTDSEERLLPADIPLSAGLLSIFWVFKAVEPA